MSDGEQDADVALEGYEASGLHEGDLSHEGVVGDLAPLPPDGDYHGEVTSDILRAAGVAACRRAF